MSLTARRRLSVSSCWFCLVEKGKHALGQFPNYTWGIATSVDMEPCQRCAEFLELGIMLMSVSDGEGVSIDLWCLAERAGGAALKVPRPYRTGGWCVIKRDHLVGLCLKHGVEYQSILDTGWACLDDSVWDLLGLPR